MIRTPSKGLRALAAGLLTSLALTAAALPPGTDAEIFERTRPWATVNLPESDGTEEVAEAASTGPGGPEEIYNSYCVACHSAGVAGAPVLADAGQWEPRIAKGMETLYESTYNGLNNVMPARGTCMECSDEDLRETVDWMVAQVEE